MTNCKVVKLIKLKDGREIPLVDMPMMSDYTWQRNALISRLENMEFYAKIEDVHANIAYLEQWLAEHTPNGERKKSC